MEGETPMPPTGFSSIEWRIRSLERRTDILEHLEPAVVKQQVSDLRDDIAEVREDMRSVKRALYTLAFSITGGAVLFAFTAFQIWGKT